MSGPAGSLSSNSADAAARRRTGSVLVALLCLAIFLVDTLSPLDMAIAVLYVVVVTLSATLFGRTGLVTVAGVCVLLTILSFGIIHATDYNISSAMRCFVSVAAIAVTTFLTLRNQQATGALKEQAALLDLSHDAIFVRNLSDTVVYWNRGAERLYGWTRAEALGQPAGALLKTDYPAPRAEIMGAVLETGHWEGEIVQTTRDGGKLVCASRWSLQRDARGRPSGIMETSSDITERQKAEQELHQVRSDLAHVTRVSTMGELTASIAHEVNQPLAAVVTNGEACLRWLRRAEPDLGEAESSVTRMIANARRASDVVERLRAFARRGTPVRQALDSAELVEDCVLLLERELWNHRVRLELALAPGLPLIEGDRIQLQQVLINLVLNAIQAMEEVPESRRVLHIGTALATPPWPTDGEAELTICVRDTGPGIAPDMFSTLFSPFVSTKEDGMGLGLSISRSIAQAHGGRINAALNNEGGMCFSLTLPISGATSPSSPRDIRP